MNLIEFLTKVESGELEGREIIIDNGLYIIIDKEVKVKEGAFKGSTLINFNNTITYEIIEENRRWKPKINESYYYVDVSGDVCDDTWDEYEIDNFRYSTGNCFKTEKETEEYKKGLLIKQKVKDMSYEFSKEEWEDDDIYKYCIKYGYKVCGCCVTHTYTCKGSEFYFKTQEDAQKCLDEIGREDCKKYILGVE